MKSLSRFLLSGVLAVAALALLPGSGLPGSSLRAQDESENNGTSSTTYDSTGKVMAISAPSSMTVASRRGPFTYQIDPDVHVFKANRKAGRISDVHAGQTVTVYYFKRLGLETVARVVVLKEPAKK